MTEREVFEELAKIIGFDLSRDTSGEYASEETKLIWQGWKLRSDAQHVAEARELTVRCQEIQQRMWQQGITKNQFTTDTYRQIENDGWIEWGGGLSPIDRMDFVEVRFRNQTEGSGMAHWWVWNHTDEDDDIIAYRVIEHDGREG